MRSSTTASLRLHLLLIVGLAFVPPFILILYGDIEQRQMVVANARAEAMQVARNACSVQEELIEDGRRILFTLAQLPQVHALDRVGCAALFSTLLQECRGYSMIAAAAPDGELLASAPAAGQVNLYQRAFFQRVLSSRGFVMGGYQICEVSGKQSIALAHPVLDSGGTIVAVLVLGIDLGWLNEMIPQGDLPANATFTLLDYNGIVLARYPDGAAWVGKSLPDSPHMRIVREKNEGLDDATGVDGVRRLYGFTSLHFGNDVLYVRVGLPKADIFAVADASRARSLILMCLVGAVVFLVTHYMARRLVLKHVDALLEVTRKVARGDLNARIGPPYRAGELGELASALDEMSCAIEQRQSETDQRNRHMNSLLQGARAILHHRSLTEIARVILELCRESIGARCGYIALRSEDGRVNRILLAQSDEDEALWGPVDDMGNCALGHAVYQAGSALCWNEAQNNPTTGTLPKGHLPLANILASPLIIDGKSVGIISLGNKEGGFSENDLDVVTGFSELAAIALRNSWTLTSLEESRERFRAVAESATDAIISVDSKETIIFWNVGAQAIFGYRADEMVGKSIERVIPDGLWHIRHRAPWPHRFGRVRVELTGMRSDGGTFPLELSLATWQGADAVNYTCIVRDISDRKQVEDELCKYREHLERLVTERTVELRSANEHLEQEIATRQEMEARQRALEGQLRQVQKLEAIGTLAGGVAHDFNNILGIIVGYAELTLMVGGAPDTVRGYMQDLLKATDRARELTRQILTFSRQTDQALKPIRLCHIVKEVLKMVRASLPTTIEIRQRIDSKGLVMADPTQIHQVLLNLCTNAAHAMREHGGYLEVNLDGVTVGTGSSSLPNLSAGHYLKLAVRDSGHGMDAAVKERIFEPYFTTKKVGEGTGLGLAVVHGIVKSLGGGINVESRPGGGTLFEVLLPEYLDRVISEEASPALPPRGEGRILLAEDETELRQIMTLMMQHLGYKVVAKADGQEALEAFRGKPNGFDLVITDLTMPRLTGLEFAGELQKLRPDLPVVLCTGFSDHVAEEKLLSLGIQGLVNKPVVVQELAEMIRRVLRHE